MIDRRTHVDTMEVIISIEIARDNLQDNVYRRLWHQNQEYHRQKVKRGSWGTPSRSRDSTPVRGNPILGMEWLKQEHATIDWKNGEIYFGRQRKAAYWRPAEQILESYDPVILGPENTEEEWIPHYERILNNFPEFFYEHMEQPRKNLVQHNIKLHDSLSSRIKRKKR